MLAWTEITLFWASALLVHFFTFAISVFQLCIELGEKAVRYSKRGVCISTSERWILSNIFLSTKALNWFHSSIHYGFTFHTSCILHLYVRRHMSPCTSVKWTHNLNKVLLIFHANLPSVCIWCCLNIWKTTPLSMKSKASLQIVRSFTWLLHNINKLVQTVKAKP